MTKAKQQPIRLPTAGKKGIRTQFGALCYRIHKDKIQVLLVTTRSQKHWIVPKGWPMDHATPAQAAAREAFEEAGAEGNISNNCYGIYSYTKDVNGDKLPCVVALFALKVKRLHAIFPEKGQRKRKWFGRKKAAAQITSPELRQLIREFDPNTTLP